MCFQSCCKSRGERGCRRLGGRAGRVKKGSVKKTHTDVTSSCLQLCVDELYPDAGGVTNTFLKFLKRIYNSDKMRQCSLRLTNDSTHAGVHRPVVINTWLSGGGGKGGVHGGRGEGGLAQLQAKFKLSFYLHFTWFHCYALSYSCCLQLLTIWERSVSWLHSPPQLLYCYCCSIPYV